MGSKFFGSNFLGGNASLSGANSFGSTFYGRKFGEDFFRVKFHSGKKRILGRKML